jgi:hypothetical protein
VICLIQKAINSLQLIFYQIHCNCDNLLKSRDAFDFSISACSVRLRSEVMRLRVTKVAHLISARPLCVYSLALPQSLCESKLFQ